MILSLFLIAQTEITGNNYQILMKKPLKIRLNIRFQKILNYVVVYQIPYRLKKPLF